MIEFYQQESFRKHFYDCLKGTFGRQTGETNLSLEAGSSDSIFVFASLDASLTVSTQGLDYTLAGGMYAALKRPRSIRCQSGYFWYVSIEGFEALNTLGGPPEAYGRLRYIDGCTDSLLIGPVIKGDPCLNLLYFPPGIDQTMHTHPSCRIGLVLSGAGCCDDGVMRTPLVPGLVFHIPLDTPHRFITQDQPMRILAFHPDSDFGPDHQFHPMVNKTMVNGVSANQLPEIQTTDEKLQGHLP